MADRLLMIHKRHLLLEYSISENGSEHLFLALCPASWSAADGAEDRSAGQGLVIVEPRALYIPNHSERGFPNDSYPK